MRGPPRPGSWDRVGNHVQNWPSGDPTAAAMDHPPPRSLCCIVYTVGPQMRQHSGAAPRSATSGKLFSCCCCQYPARRTSAGSLLCFSSSQFKSGAWAWFGQALLAAKEMQKWVFEFSVSAVEGCEEKTSGRNWGLSWVFLHGAVNWHFLSLGLWARLRELS